MGSGASGVDGGKGIVCFARSSWQRTSVNVLLPYGIRKNFRKGQLTGNGLRILLGPVLPHSGLDYVQGSVKSPSILKEIPNTLRFSARILLLRCGGNRKTK